MSDTTTDLGSATNGATPNGTGTATADIPDDPLGTGNGAKEASGLIVRFAGDSGDGMQLTGDRFTSASAIYGNDISTLPDFPAEIRAPHGSIYGVSAFQLHISDHDINTPGDSPNVLVAMNPAALKSELGLIDLGSTVIINQDSFEPRNLEKAGYDANPLEDDTLDNYSVILAPMTSLTKEVCKDLGLKPRDAERSKNFFALGLVSWLYNRPTEPTIEWVNAKFAGKDSVIAANIAAFKAGHAYGETAELSAYRVEVKPAELAPGTYTNINGNTALAWGLVAASQQAKLPLFLGSYPITPASDLLHELSNLKDFGVRTFQAEDEIAAVCSAVGASYGGHIGITTTSGPGVALKGEAIGLAISLELPLLIVDVQRGGPSTGLPTKTEASDLLLSMFGRHGEAPLPVLAANSPTHCFEVAIEAVRIALKYKTPVILLSDGYIANGSEPWKLPDVNQLPDISVKFTTQPNATDADGREVLQPYRRDPETLAPPWVIPGTPNLMHRKGGLEKQDLTGNISYDPVNHHEMTLLRDSKIKNIAGDIAPTILNTCLEEGDKPDMLVLGWGSTWGAIYGAVRRVRRAGYKVDQAHLVHLNPLPPDLEDILSRYDTILIPEMNLGQLHLLIRARYLVDAISMPRVKGLPFTSGTIQRRMLEILEEKKNNSAAA